MILELAFLGIAVMSLVAAEMKDLVHAIIVMAATDVVVAVAFYLMGAPDIAITQLAVVAGLSTLIFMLAINRTHRMEGVEE